MRRSIFKNSASMLMLQAISLAALASVSVPAIAMAQETSGDETSANEEVVTVTGTRIKRPNLTSVSPITSVYSKEVQLQGATQIENVMNAMPQFEAGENENASNGATGTASLNLRGLGSERNLVLIDGQRMMPVMGTDLNFIPSTLVERVDVLSGGASSVYGSDAISGVVNYVMRKNLQGIRVDSNYSINQHTNDDSYLRGIQSELGFKNADKNVWDGQKYDFNIAIGSNFKDDRGNITAYYGYRKVEAVTQDARDYSACALELTDGGDGFYCGGSGNTDYGRITPQSGPNKGVQFVNTKDGNHTWDVYDSSYAYNYTPDNYIQRDDERSVAGVFFNYDVTPKTNFYGSFMFMEDVSYSQVAPSAIWLGTTYTINCDNPYLSDSQKTQLCGSTTSTDNATALVGYRASNGLPRRDYLKHTDWRFNTGLKGDLSDAVSYDVSYLTSKISYKENYQNDINQERAANALQAVEVDGVITCKSVIDGTDPDCVPIDVFSYNGPSEEAWDYLYSPSYTSSEQTMDILSGTLNVDFGKYNIKSPWASYGIAAVFGAEYRKESYEFNADEVAQQNGTTNSDGKITSDEIFTELSVPLVSDKLLVDKLDLELGYRYGSYEAHSSTSDSPDHTIKTYKVGLQYAPVRDIGFRVSYNKATRAPNIYELFQAQSVGNVSAVDPCAGANPTATLAQCQLSGVTAEQYGYITECPAATCSTLYGGNPDLKPETAKTLTAGVVFTPKKIPGLNITIDYFNIKVEDYISSVDSTLAISECFDNSNSYFCSLLVRDSSSGNLFGTNSGYIVGTLMNTGYLKTSGVDLSASYRLRTDEFAKRDYGSIDFSLNGTYTAEKITLPLPGLDEYDCVGYYGNACGQPSPKWKHSFRTTWNLPNLPLSVSLNWRYIGGTKLYSSTSIPINNKIEAYNYFDLAADYNINKKVNLRIGINNMFDKDPPAIAYSLLSEYGNGNTYPGTYSSLGRTLFVGLTAEY